MTAVFRENSRMMVVCVVCGFFCTCHVHLALFVNLHSASCLWFCVRSLCNSINGKGNLDVVAHNALSVTQILSPQYYSSENRLCSCLFYLFNLHFLAGGCSAACYQNAVNAVFQMDSGYCLP